MEQTIQKTIQKFNKNAIIGFIFGLISVYFSLAIITGPLAVIFSVKALRQIKVINEKGEKLALIGLILGIIFFILGLITLFTWC
ncbi:MAG: hypothetical protein A2V69_00550 [Candidatus Portnoybacteria bacterium RBG_13_40_8]|uniref:DUF4190 domain-containing protein n=1 Tax=Candidatus Portnoybacteria bacterium RBG_13_40_8 TaxID=1801990 RepID=A0A1G2F1I6_9BACT|nr:MAG: hypothetical protein A2V69_00550 [Candidatus Portnoybacteria bacterium RBG_13_40_8]OGZ34436.1 MAG: hypothetical protein A2V60_01705 [Candidatus Portnoybacteria bacterium RIFCSPHIGHO2_01_FULL_39_19]